MALDLMQRQAGSSPQALSRSVAHALREDTWVRKEDRRELETILDLSSSVEDSAKGARLGGMLSEHAGKAVVFTRTGIFTCARAPQRCSSPFCPYDMRYACFVQCSPSIPGRYFSPVEIDVI